MSVRPTWRPLWPLRATWLVLPVLVGPALADALGDRSRSVQVVGSLLAWGIWGLCFIAMLVPRTITLTLVRLTVPGALGVALWSAIGAERPVWAAVGVATGAAALLAMAAPGVSDAFVDGSSYGSERRVALRVPPLVLAGPAPLAWALGAAAIVSGPLLLAAAQWVAGAIAIVVGIPVLAVVVWQVHVLSRRWLVFVPAGIVVHDPLLLTEPLLLQRHHVTRVGPAMAGADGFDATGGALGLALELRASRPISVGVRRGRARDERDGVTSLLVTPSRPASTLEIASAHRLPVA